MAEETETKKIICVTCPRGCSLTIKMQNGQVLEVTGNNCKRGEIYAKSEMTDPKRMVASTVRIKGGVHPLLPVSLSEPFPKNRIMELMAFLKEYEAQAPVKMGDVLVKDLLGTQVSLIASRDMDKSA